MGLLLLKGKGFVLVLHQYFLPLSTGAGNTVGKPSGPLLKDPPPHTHTQESSILSFLEDEWLDKVGKWDYLVFSKKQTKLQVG